MKIKDKVKVRDVAGEHIIMRVGDGKTADMTTVIALNESSLLLYNGLRGRDFSVDDAVAVLTEEYSVDEATARRDVEAWLSQMTDNGLME